MMKSKKYNKLDGFKLGLEFLTSAGTDRVLAAIIKNNVPKGNVYQNVAVFTARVCVGVAISTATAKVMNRQIDELSDAIKLAKIEINEAKLNESTDT